MIYKIKTIIQKLKDSRRKRTDTYEEKTSYEKNKIYKQKKTETPIKENEEHYTDRRLKEEVIHKIKDRKYNF